MAAQQLGGSRCGKVVGGPSANTQHPGVQCEVPFGMNIGKVNGMARGSAKVAFVTSMSFLGQQKEYATDKGPG